MTTATTVNSDQTDERTQAIAALTAAIVQMIKVIGCDQTARVLGSVAIDLNATCDGSGSRQRVH